MTSANQRETRKDRKFVHVEEGRGPTTIKYYNNEIEISIDNEENSGSILCAKCSPCRLRVNAVILLLLCLFSLGAAIGAYTRPLPSATLLDESQSHDGQSRPGSTCENINIDCENNDQENINVDTDYLVGVYYYPWHGTGNTFHNGDGYLRSQLQPPQRPVLGEYDDRKPEVIEQHLEWSRQANVGLWVTSWWGPNKLEDKNTKGVILQHNDLGDMKIALHYETAGRIDVTSNKTDISNVRSDTEYICETYFSHPNYFKIDGRPVIVLYISRYLAEIGILEDVLVEMKTAAQGCGHDIYIIGDHVFGDAPRPSRAFDTYYQLDAVTNYDVYGSMGRPIKYAGAEPIDEYYREQKEWRSHAIMSGRGYIPAVSPGYNDRGVRLTNDHPPLARKLSADADEGSMFRYQLQKALPLVDPKASNLVLVNSFNEWHEDTQIEPVAGIIASLPVLLTGGLQYESYGDLYLNILRESTRTNKENTYPSSD